MGCSLILLVMGRVMRVFPEKVIDVFSGGLRGIRLGRRISILWLL